MLHSIANSDFIWTVVTHNFIAAGDNINAGNFVAIICDLLVS